MSTNKSLQIKIQIRDMALTSMEAALEDVTRYAAGGEATMENLLARKEQCNGYYSQFMKGQEAVVQSCFKSDQITAAAIADKVASAVHLKLVTAIEAVMAKIKEKQIKVPRINEIRLTKFSGKPTGWVEWRARFEQSVMNTGLEADQKIDLLMDALEGEARASVGGTARRDTVELDRIWKKLNDQYDDTYRHIEFHVRTILEYPTIMSPSAEEFRKMINIVEEQLRLLDKYDDLGSQQWSTIVAVSLLGKLDKETRYLWNTSPDKPKRPELRALFQFLYVRSRAMDTDLFQTKSIAETTSHKSNSFNARYREEIKPYSRSLVDQSLRTFLCVACSNKNSEHATTNCPKFLKLSTFERKRLITYNEFCPRCIREGHQVSYCRSTNNCRFCSSAKHHYLLCDAGKENKQSN